VFNNGFGLGSDAQAGGELVQQQFHWPIEQLQVSVAPFDVPIWFLQDRY
jgi:hypothetical protein